jgi:ergothioneine biosynthesis protein EgtB
MTSLTVRSVDKSAADLRVRTLAQRFEVVRAATLSFTEPLSPEDQMVQSSAEASPVKWHLAHTSWFFETFVLTPYVPGYQAFHPDFHWLFNSYYNALGEMPAKKLRASFSRPSLHQILAYRTHVDTALRALLARLEGAAIEEADEIERRITLGLEHEQQHLELIATDIKHALYTNPLHPAYLETPLTAEAPEPGNGATKFIEFAGGLTEIGITPAEDDPLAFAFDNETPRHTVFLQPYAMANRLVTVAEYLAFMNDNGYMRPELWLSEGWTLQRAEGWQAPLYFCRDSASAAGWKIYTLRGFVPVEALLHTPVCHLSYFEADAYARWAGARLPTEFEWEHAAESLGQLLKGSPQRPELVSYTAPADGARFAVVTGTAANMLESGALHPAPAAPVSGLQQCFGDVWEWTSSGYTGYPGYSPLPGALGEYNGKFMSSQLILRGGSCVTPAAHIRLSYRNFFPPATRWQFSGLRLAKNLLQTSSKGV